MGMSRTRVRGDLDLRHLGTEHAAMSALPLRSARNFELYALVTVAPPAESQWIGRGCRVGGLSALGSRGMSSRQ